MGCCGLRLCSTHSCGAGGMRLLPKCSAMAAAPCHSPSALPALFSWVSRSSQDLLCFPGYKAKERARSGRLHPHCAASASPARGSGGAPRSHPPPGVGTVCTVPLRDRPSRDGWVQFATLRSCSACGTAAGVREQPEDGHCLCWGGWGGAAADSDARSAPPEPRVAFPPPHPGLCGCSPSSPTLQLPELRVRAGPAPFGAPKSVSGALCKVTLNMQHLHKYIYISTVRCVGSVRAAAAPRGSVLRERRRFVPRAVGDAAR